MATKPNTTENKTEETKRTRPDKSPQGDLKKMLILGASARSKFIKDQDEERGAKVFEIMKQILELSADKKTEAA